ncbi:VacJ-like lipoprotein, partial [mine drainage metagenome]
MPSFSRALRLLAATALLVAVAGCAIQPARDDDPWQATNRKIFNFNQKFDNAVAKPVARGYVKVTSAEVRLMVSNFFDNLQMPISIVNDVLQVRPVGAAQNTGRFLVNSTIGLAGLFDPAGKLGLHQDTTDFGVTLARWGVPQGPYLVIPFLGPSSVRDFPAYLVDTYFLNPMSYWVRDYHFRYYTEYLPYTLYLVQLRASLLNTDQFLSSAYDPYVMLRDAYLQRRNYLIYHGNPPTSLQENFEQRRCWRQRQWGRRIGYGGVVGAAARLRSSPRHASDEKRLDAGCCSLGAARGSRLDRSDAGKFGGASACRERGAR